MNKFLLLTAFVALLAQLVYLPVEAVVLELSREEVAIPFCVNRERPALDCWGSCYINRHLEAALAQDQIPANTKEVLLPSFSPIELTETEQVTLRKPNDTGGQLRPEVPAFHSADVYARIFHPPRLS